jgi:hypothetical protein
MFCTTFLKSGKVEPKNLENHAEKRVDFLKVDPKCFAPLF